MARVVSPAVSAPRRPPPTGSLGGDPLTRHLGGFDRAATAAAAASRSAQKKRQRPPIAVVGLVGNLQRRDTALALLEHVTGHRLESLSSAGAGGVGSCFGSTAGPGGSASSSGSSNSNAAGAAVAAAGALQMLFDATANVLFLVSPFAVDLHRKIHALVSGAGARRRGEPATTAAARVAIADQQQQSASHFHQAAAAGVTEECGSGGIDDDADAQRHFSSLATMFSVCHQVYVFHDAGRRAPALDPQYLSLLRHLRAFRAGTCVRARGGASS